MLKKKEYFKVVRRPYPPLICSLVCMGYLDTEQFEGILSEPYVMMDMVHVDNTWYYGKEDLERGGQLALEHWSNPEVFERIQSEFNLRADRLVAASEKSFEEFTQAYQAYMPPLFLVYAIEQPTEHKLRAALLRRVSGDKVDQIECATKVLKDGDKVEVDADNGVVKMF